MFKKLLVILLFFHICVANSTNDTPSKDDNVSLHDQGTDLLMFGGSLIVGGILMMHPAPCLIGCCFIIAGDTMQTHHKKQLATEKEARKIVCQNIKKSMMIMLCDHERYPLLMKILTKTDCDKEFNINDNVDNSDISIMIKNKHVHLLYNGIPMSKNNISIDSFTETIVTESIANIIKTVSINNIKIYRCSCDNQKI